VCDVVERCDAICAALMEEPAYDVRRRDVITTIAVRGLLEWLTGHMTNILCL
jgi:hypothetical protein